jgi:hypothetical protein
MNIGNKIEQIGFRLPEVPRPVAAYIMAKQSGKLFLVLADSPWSMVNEFQKDLLGQNVAVEDANKAAQVCRLNVLAAKKA